MSSTFIHLNLHASLFLEGYSVAKNQKLDIHYGADGEFCDLCGLIVPVVNKDDSGKEFHFGHGFKDKKRLFSVKRCKTCGQFHNRAFLLVLFIMFPMGIFSMVLGILMVTEFQFPYLIIGALPVLGGLLFVFSPVMMYRGYHFAFESGVSN